MRPFKIAGIAVAMLSTVTLSAFAQTQAKSDDKNATQTFTGCLMTEPAYRSAHKLGAGALGGAGLGDEYVLVDAKIAPAGEMPATTRSSDSTAAVASPSATACADQGAAYRLNGSLEPKLKGLVGHQVEIQGRLKDADSMAADGSRPAEKLPAEVVIVSFREAPAPAAVSEPVTAPAPPPPPPPPPPTTVEPARAPAIAPATTEPSTLPHTASALPLVALIGVIALSAGVALAVVRRRAL